MLQAGREAPQATTQALKLIMHKLHRFIRSCVYSGILKTLLSNNREPPPSSALPASPHRTLQGNLLCTTAISPKQTCIHGSMKN